MQSSVINSPQQPISACDEPMFEPVQNIKQKCVNKNFCHPVNSDCHNNLTMPITEPLMPTKLCLYPRFEFDQVYPNCAVQSSCQTDTSIFQPPYGGAREGRGETDASRSVQLTEATNCAKPWPKNASYEQEAQEAHKLYEQEAQELMEMCGGMELMRPLTFNERGELVDGGEMGGGEVEDLLKTIFGGLRKKEEEVSKVESAEDAFWQAVFSEEE